MDYSKWRKIFYILAIVSMLLSIGSRVFAVEYVVTYESIRDVYDTRVAYWVLTLSQSSDSVRNAFISHYTDTRFFPFFTVYEPNKGWGGASDVPQTSLAFTHHYVYFFDLTDYTVETTTSTQYMGFQGSNVLKFNGPCYYASNAVGSSFNTTTYNYSVQHLQMPMILFNYRSPIMEGYVNAVLNNDTESITQAINNATDKILSTNVDSSTQSEMNSNINRNNTTNSDNVSTNFFSSLLSMVSNLQSYNLADDTTITIPLPNSQQSLILHSNYLYNLLPSAFKVLINGFWLFLFGFYFFKFINKIVISVKSGNILEGLKSSDDVITNDML